MSALRRITGRSWSVFTLAVALSLAAWLTGSHVPSGVETALVVGSLVALAAAGFLMTRDLRET